MLIPTFRPFDEADWQAFGGAEAFAPGCGPFICDDACEGVIYLVDALGRHAYFGTTDQLEQDEATIFTTGFNALEWPTTPKQAKRLRWDPVLSG